MSFIGLNMACMLFNPVQPLPPHSQDQTDRIRLGRFSHERVVCMKQSTTNSTNSTCYYNESNILVAMVISSDNYQSVWSI